MKRIINVLGLNILIKPIFKMLEERSRQYEVKHFEGSVDFAVEVSIDEIRKYKEINPHLSEDEIEYILTSIIFYKKIINYDAFLLHSSSISVKDFAYSFSAPSGGGKSTHTNLYLGNFKNSFIINDDKPAYRYIDGEFYVYGTPWSGKNNISKNVCIPLKGLCFIKKAQENSIRLLSNNEALHSVLAQTIRFKDNNMQDKLLTLLDKFISKYNIYECSCDISKEAVQMSYEIINNKGVKE